MSDEAIMLIAKGCEHYEKIKRMLEECPVNNVKVLDFTRETNDRPVVIINNGEINVQKAPLLIIEEGVCGPESLPMLFFEGDLYCIDRVDNRKIVWSTDEGDLVNTEFPPCEALITRTTCNPSPIGPNNIFELRRRGKVMARMVAKFGVPSQPDSFTVLKESTARSGTLQSTTKASKQKREKLKQNGILKPDQTGKLLVFQRDYPFSSPSAASDMITASNTDGWKEFKLPDGRKLEEFRNQLDPDKEEK